MEGVAHAGIGEGEYACINFSALSVGKVAGTGIDQVVPITSVCDSVELKTGSFRQLIGEKTAIEVTSCIWLTMTTASYAESTISPLCTTVD